MKTKVEKAMQNCANCAPRNAPIHQRPSEENPFALIEVDLKGPLPS
jgi:hypothetical protein